VLPARLHALSIPWSATPQAHSSNRLRVAAEQHARVTRGSHVYLTWTELLMVLKSISTTDEHQHALPERPVRRSARGAHGGCTALRMIGAGGPCA